MRFRFVALLALALPFGAAHCPAQSSPLAPPVLPLHLSYRYWPVQLVQFVGTELPYSQILLEVDPAGKKPLLSLTLTDRGSGKRIHYAETDALVAAGAAMGDEAHKAAMAWEPADTETTGSVSTLRLTLADGKPLVWRFVQGSDVSERGGGLSPIPGSPIPVFAYREQAAVAGEGTALSVGGVVSQATVWTEVSQPPYFVAYHGALSESAHTLVFLPGAAQWSVKSAPATLAAGGSWELDTSAGNHVTLHIDKASGDDVTVTETDMFEPGVKRVLEAKHLADGGWSFARVRLMPLKDSEKHTLTVEFATPLLASTDSTAFKVIAGKKTVLGQGSVQGRTVSFSDPGWMKGISVRESGQ